LYINIKKKNRTETPEKHAITPPLVNEVKYTFKVLWFLVIIQGDGSSDLSRLATERKW
jgi:hypothetical protein